MRVSDKPDVSMLSKVPRFKYKEDHRSVLFDIPE
jgi:hypothetical protein